MQQDSKPCNLLDLFTEIIEVGGIEKYRELNDHGPRVQFSLPPSEAPAVSSAANLPRPYSELLRSWLMAR